MKLKNLDQEFSLHMYTKHIHRHKYNVLMKEFCCMYTTSRETINRANIQVPILMIVVGEILFKNLKSLYSEGLKKLVPFGCTEKGALKSI